MTTIYRARNLCRNFHAFKQSLSMSPQNKAVLRVTRSYKHFDQLNSVIFFSIGFLHMGQTSNDVAHSTHVPWPHMKATLRAFSRQMAHILASSISLTCARSDSNEWSVSKYLSSVSLNSAAVSEDVSSTNNNNKDKIHLLNSKKLKLKLTNAKKSTF